MAGGSAPTQLVGRAGLAGFAPLGAPAKSRNRYSVKPCITKGRLKVETAMDDIVLPIGTKIETISDSQIDIELPSNYQFLLFDDKNGASFSRFGSYSCTCSAKNSCKVFYNPKVGYGCLQNSCSGSCIGKPSGDDATKTAYGIINNDSGSLLGEKFIAAGNLTHKGYEIFIEHVAKDELNEFFDFAFSAIQYNNAEELITIKGRESVTQVLLQYKGIYISAMVPNFDNEKESQLIDFQSGPYVSCAGSNGCSCTKDKTCILGNCVYYCDGCTTCTMTVEKNSKKSGLK